MLKKGALSILSAIVLLTGCGDFRGAEPSPTYPSDEQIGSIEGFGNRARENEQIRNLQGTDGRFGALQRQGQGTNEDANPDKIKSEERGADKRETLKVTIDQQETEELPGYIRDGQTYVSLTAVLDFLGYETRVSKDGRFIEAGFTDVLYRIEKDSAQAMVVGRNVTLPSRTIVYNGQAYVTTNALPELLKDVYNIHSQGNSINFETVEAESVFPGNEDLGDVKQNENEEAKDAPAMSRGKARRIIRTARQFVGRPYDFGAETGNTRAFDCSSFTEYVYGVHGINLPRVSRHQAKVGRYVPVSQLQAGDLVFFFWPGRFYTNRVVGHVGIYMGDGYVIHATPSRGVHITKASESRYWRATYLGAKRVS